MEAVVERLKAARWTVFRDEESLDSNEPFWQRLPREIDAARVVVVFWSHTAIGSSWVYEEASRGFKQKKLIAARLDAVEPPFGLSGLHAVDLIGVRGQEEHSGIDRILELIQEILGVPEPDVDKAEARAMRRLRKRFREARKSVLFALPLAFVSIWAVASGYGALPHMRLLSLSFVTQLKPNDALRVVMIDSNTENTLSSQRFGSGTTLGAFGENWRGVFARAITRIAESNAKVIAMDIAFTRASDPAVPERRTSTAQLARAISAARARGTAVALLATNRDPRTGALAVAPEIQTALSSPSVADGFLSHGCVGITEGFATLAPLVLPGKIPSYSLALSSVAGYRRARPSWQAAAKTLGLASEAGTITVEYTGLGPKPTDKEPECRVAEGTEHPVYRVIAPFPKDLRRTDQRVLPFEDIVTASSSAELVSTLSGRIVLIGLQLDNSDMQRTCTSKGCLESIHGLSLHAATIDTLFAPTINIISPKLQLCWIAILCIAGAWARFVSVGSGWVLRFGLLAGLVVIDVALSIVLASKWSLLVDTLHHIAALGMYFFIVSRFEPALEAFQRRMRRLHSRLRPQPRGRRMNVERDDA